MKVCIFLLALCVSLSGVKSTGTALPKLSQQFQTNVQANIVHKNQSLSQTIYFDYVNNRGAAYVWLPGDEQTIELYDFEQYEVYKISVTAKTCMTSDLQTDSDVSLHYFNQSGVGHIVHASDWLEFSEANVSLVSSDNEFANGIRVDKWESTRTSEDTTVIHYFNSATFQMPGIQLGQQVPVKTEVKIGKDFYEVYDYMTFLPGPVQDPSVFEIPRGYHCERKQNHKAPTWSDNFSVRMEILHPQNATVKTGKFVYNFNHNLSKEEVVPASDSPLYKVYKNQEIHVIHDFSSGLKYILSELTADKMECNVSPLVTSSPAYHDYKEVDGHYEMKHGYELLGTDKKNFTWQGVREVRGIMCDVWSAVNKTTNTTSLYESYAAQSNWNKSTGDETDEPTSIGHWMGILSTTDNGVEIVTDTEIHVFEYSVQVSVNDFDIRPCYDSSEQMIHCMFNMIGSYNDVVKRREHILGPAVRDAVSKATLIEPIRVADVYFDPNSEDGVNVWITLLDKPSVKGSIKNPYPQVDKEKAYDALKSQIKSGQFKVTTIEVVKDSLKTDKEVMDPRQPPEQKTGYTAGAMAGIGIGMLITGIILAIVGMYAYQWRKGRQGMPYQRSETI